MALTDENNGFYMPVAPAYGGGYGNGNGFGGDGWWILLLLLCGWGGMGGFGGFGGGFGGMYEFPWLLNGQNGINANTNAGFDHAATQGAISALQSSVTGGFGDVQLGIAGVNQAICQTGNGITAAVTGAQNTITQQMYGNEIASLNRSFAEQTANMQGFNGVNSGVADLRYTVATEACADRAAVGDALQNVTMQNMGNTNAIVNAITAGIQSIKDDLCQDRLDAERRENQNLRSELMYARGQASQVEQTAQIRAGQATTANQLVNELRSCPIPSQPVYGNQPIFTCGNGGCGCGGSF